MSYHSCQESPRRKTLADKPRLRVSIILNGVLLPWLAIAFSGTLIDPTPDALWQDGNASTYIGLLLQMPSLLPFTPLLAYSSGCLIALMLQPARITSIPIRIGILSGLLLSVQFFVMVCVMVSVMLPLVIALWVSPFVFLSSFAIYHLGKRMHRFTILHLLLLTTLCAVLAVLWRIMPQRTQITGALFSYFVMAAAASPLLCLLTYLRIGNRVLSDNMGNPIPMTTLLPSITAWLLAWLASWRIAVWIMLAEYEKLPTTNPNCYVSAAAASGHRRFVGAQVISSDSSGSRIANMQMRRLKFLEIVLQTAFPRVHRRLRKAYNSTGPSLAGCCRCCPWAADLTYILLKPLEAAAELLRHAACIPKRELWRIYSNNSAEFPRSGTSTESIHSAPSTNKAQ